MIGDDITAALPELRAQAESLMVHTCELQAKTGTTVDPDNGQRIDQWETYWSGRCSYRSSRQAQVVRVGGQEITTVPTDFRIPWNSPRPEVDHRIVTSAGTFTVTNIDYHSTPVQLRFSAVADQG